jgi:hypothetical protein
MVNSEPLQTDEKAIAFIQIPGFTDNLPDTTDYLPYNHL